MTIEDIALQMTPGIGIKGAAHLLELFGDAQSIFAATADELTAKAGIRPEAAQQLIRRKGFPRPKKSSSTAAATASRPSRPQIRNTRPCCGKSPITLMCCTSKETPKPFRPAVFQSWGHATRHPTDRRPVTDWSEVSRNRVPGLCIVSGLAFGIDVAAHRAALAAGVPTVAVLANPLPGVTPAQHTDVARDILAHGGALVTELHSQSKQNGNFYLARNRIIAGLSAGCIVAESPDTAVRSSRPTAPTPTTGR